MLPGDFGPTNLVLVISLAVCVCSMHAFPYRHLMYVVLVAQEHQLYCHYLNDITMDTSFVEINRGFPCTRKNVLLDELRTYICTYSAGVLLI